MLRDRQRKERTLWIEFHNFWTPLQMRCISTEVFAKFLAYLWTVEQILYYCLSGQHSNTRVPLSDRNELSLESRFQIQHWMFIILNLVAECCLHFNYITTSALQTLPINYKLQKTHSDLTSTVCKKNPDINLLCEAQVTVILCRAASIISDSDKHFLTIRKNSCSCSFLNIFTTV